MPLLARTTLDVSPLCLGGNVFGWTADEPQSFAILDAYAASGGNFVDTADVYASWVKGNVGGESETILGRWMASRKNRSSIIIATKVGMLATHKGLAPRTLKSAVEASLKRLQTDYIDLYYAHQDDEKTPQEDTLNAFDPLVKSGKVRHIGASNFTAARLASALTISKEEELAKYVALQPHYNLMERGRYEGELADLCKREGVSCVPYFSLAKGFLTGKYRPGVKVESARTEGATAYLHAKGLAVLAALDALAEEHRVSVAAIALAWLSAQPTVASVIASARTPEQLTELVAMTGVKLTPHEMGRLTAASTDG